MYHSGLSASMDSELHNRDVTCCCYGIGDLKIQETPILTIPAILHESNMCSTSREGSKHRSCFRVHDAFVSQEERPRVQRVSERGKKV